MNIIIVMDHHDPHHDVVVSVQLGHDHHVPGLLLQLVQEEGGWLPVALCVLVPCNPGGLCGQAGRKRSSEQKLQTLAQFTY